MLSVSCVWYPIDSIIVYYNTVVLFVRVGVVFPAPPPLLSLSESNDTAGRGQHKDDSEKQVKSSAGFCTVFIKLWGVSSLCVVCFCHFTDPSFVCCQYSYKSSCVCTCLGRASLGACMSCLAIDGMCTHVCSYQYMSVVTPAVWGDLHWNTWRRGINIIDIVA